MKCIQFCSQRNTSHPDSIHISSLVGFFMCSAAAAAEFAMIHASKTKKRILQRGQIQSKAVGLPLSQLEARMTAEREVLRSCNVEFKEQI